MNRRLVAAVLSLFLLIPTSGCGTIFFSERQGQHREEAHVDPNIVILDALGLLLFIVPGVVAFGVDFATSAIYLPPDVERGEGPFIYDEPRGS